MYQSDGDVRRIRKYEPDFLKLASSPPVLREKDPTHSQHRRALANTRRVPAGPAISKSMGNDDGGGVSL